MVTNIIIRGGVPDSDLKDCSQEAWITCWRYRHKFNPAKGSLTTFIALQARAAASWYRRKRSSQIHFLGHPVAIAEDYHSEDDPLAGHEIAAYVPSTDDRAWSWMTAGKVPCREKQSDPRKHPSKCKHGHDLAPENVYVAPSGDRRCRPCQNERQRKQSAIKGQERFSEESLILASKFAEKDNTRKT